MSRPSLHTSVASIFAGALLAIGCGPPPDENRVEEIKSLTGDAAAGATLFTGNCARCHGEDARSGSAGADLPAVANEDPDRAIETILTGNIVMPRFGEQLSDQQIADVLAHLKAK